MEHTSTAHKVTAGPEATRHATAEGTILHIAGRRLLESLRQFSEFGATPAGGLNRLSLGDFDKQARDELCRIAHRAGWAVRVDAVGNIFITRPGRTHNSTVLMGSHLDSQPFGGRFDGTYGVLAGLEVLLSLDDLGIETLRDITLVDWTDEEGARFAPSVLGSSVFAGEMELDHALGRTDTEGLRLGDELARIGYDGKFDPSELNIHQGFEAHIEQGPVLENTGTDVGVVTAIQGLRWFDITVQGQSRHAGTTPASHRKDALVAAARIIDWTDSLPGQIDQQLRATIGEIRVTPNSRNVVPGTVQLFADFRHPDDALLERAGKLLRDEAQRVADERGLDISVGQVLHKPTTYFVPQSINRVRNAAEHLGLSHRDMASGAGHDSMNVAGLAPTAMVFIPCVDGLSHTEAEDIRPEWAVNGADVLLNVVVESANDPEV